MQSRLKRFCLLEGKMQSWSLADSFLQKLEEKLKIWKIHVRTFDVNSSMEFKNKKNKIRIWVWIKEIQTEILTLNLELKTREFSMSQLSRQSGQQKGKSKGSKRRMQNFGPIFPTFHKQTRINGLIIIRISWTLWAPNHNPPPRNRKLCPQRPSSLNPHKCQTKEQNLMIWKKKTEEKSKYFSLFQAQPHFSLHCCSSLLGTSREKRKLHPTW